MRDTTAKTDYAIYGLDMTTSNNVTSSPYATVTTLVGVLVKVKLIQHWSTNP